MEELKKMKTKTNLDKEEIEQAIGEVVDYIEEKSRDEVTEEVVRILKLMEYEHFKLFAKDIVLDYKISI